MIWRVSLQYNWIDITTGIIWVPTQICICVQIDRVINDAPLILKILFDFEGLLRKLCMVMQISGNFVISCPFGKPVDSDNFEIYGIFIFLKTPLAGCASQSKRY